MSDDIRSTLPYTRGWTAPPGYDYALPESVLLRRAMRAVNPQEADKHTVMGGGAGGFTRTGIWLDAYRGGLFRAKQT